MRASRQLLVAFAVLGVACVTGEKQVEIGTPPTYSIGGSAHAAPATLVDGDVADTRAPVAHNDDPGSAQQLPGVVTVGGWASVAEDPYDVYRATLAAGQVVALDVADPALCELDLYLVSVAGAPAAPAQSSIGGGATRSVVVAAGGAYYVVVHAVAGTSTSYVLSLGRGVTAAAAAPDGLDAPAELVPGQVIVRFRDDARLAPGEETAERRAAALGLVARGGGPRRAMLLELPAGAPARAAALSRNGLDGPSTGLFGEVIADDRARDRMDTIRLVKALRRRPDVIAADPNYVRRALAVPDDPLYGLQWSARLVGLPLAWDVTTGTRASGDVIVAVVDTGVLPAHPDLAGKLVAGYDFVSDVAVSRDGDGLDGDPTDPGTSPRPGQSVWHGTHVAGIIAAATDNGRGVAGVSWGARLMPVRVLGLDGEGSSYDVLQGVLFAAGLPNDSGVLPARRADVVNLSLGASGSSAVEQLALNAVRAEGVIVVAAAMNENTAAPCYPASYHGVISVAAVDSRAEKARYSSFGTAVDVAAPGGDEVDRDGDGHPDAILSTYADDASGTPQMIYGFLMGTSMATAHVSGVVALMRAACPALSPEALDLALSSGALTRDLGATGRDDVYGNGLVDASAAVSWAADPARCASAPWVSTITASPANVDFGPFGAAWTAVEIARSGGDAVTGVTVTGSPAWLTVVAPGGDGLGTYRLTPSTGGLAEGLHAASLAFTATFGAGPPRTVTVQVTLQVGAASADSNAGHLYVVLVDAESHRPVAATEASAAAGAYRFTLSGVPGGTYHLLAGSDSDGDGFICDAGESCGAYPTPTEPAELDVSTSPRSLDFQVGFTVALRRAAAGAGGGLVVPPGGFEVTRHRGLAPTP